MPPDTMGTSVGRGGRLEMSEVEQSAQGAKLVRGRLLLRVRPCRRVAKSRCSTGSEEYRGILGRGQEFKKCFANWSGASSAFEGLNC